jgi:hypothetical protein
MVRPVGGAARGQKRVAPSSQELTSALMGQFGPRQQAGIQKLTGANWAGLPTASSYGEFDEIISVMGSSETMGYYKTDQERKQSRNMAGEAIAPDLSGNFGYYDSDGNPIDQAVWRSSQYGYDVDEETGELTIAGYKGPQFDEDDSPAPLTVVPTSTTDPNRPRTVAAGYDKKNFKITVVFRDGTFYNYYEVSPTEWAAFKSRVSKGKYIYQYLDSKPRGPASTAGISAAGRKAFYRFTRAAQLHYEGRPDKYSKPKKP